MADIGRKETDAKLNELERKLNKLYGQAVSEIQEKLDVYFDKFSVKDKIKQEQLKAGKITQDDYNYWRTGQLAIGERWREMRDTLAQDLTNTNQIAMSMINGYTPEVYAINHNYTAYTLERDTLIDLSFSLYDRRTVERLVRDNPELLPKASVNIPKDLRWNKQKLNSALTQGILQGEPIPKIAKRLQNVTGMNNQSAIIKARTMVTGAENAGRVDSYEHAKDMGIELEQEWMATLDNRTRDSHRHLDGERVEVGEEFSNGCRFPGDPQGPPEEVWGCRCTLIGAVKGVDMSKGVRNSKLGGMSYEEWKNEHSKDGTFKVDIPTIQSRIGSAQTVEEVNDIMNSNGWFSTHKVVHVDRNLNVTYTQEATVADLTGCDLDSAKSVASGYERIFAKYPQLIGKFAAPDSNPQGMSRNTYAWCYTKSSGKVQVNPIYYGDWKSLSEMYERDVLSGWHPKGTTAESIVTHEIGHAVDGLLAREGVLGGYNAAGEYRYASSLMRAPVMKSAGFTIKDTEFEVSRYATVNPQEWFAECFSEYITSANPRPVATAFGKRLEELLGRL